jgi:hypothetical protein
MRRKQTLMAIFADRSTCYLIYGNACPVKLKQDGKGGRRGREWFTGLANNRPMPDPPFPLLPTPILLYSPGLCDDKSSLTD